MLSVHGMGQQLPWGNIGCNKLFPSMQSLKEHEQFCREGKKYTFDFFHRMYKGIKNMKSHIKSMHLTTGQGKLLCAAVCTCISMHTSTCTPLYILGAPYTILHAPLHAPLSGRSRISPRLGHQPSRRCQHMILPNFPKTS